MMRGPWLVSICMCLTLGAVMPAWGAGNQEELLKKIEQLEQQLKSLKEQQKVRGDKEAQCTAAVGNEKFCGCIAEKLPPDVGFEEYVHLATNPKGALGYDTMTADRKQRVDETLKVRDACVEKAKGGLLW